MRELPRWILAGASVFSFGSFILAHVELGALREELGFISQVRLELLSKRFKDGRKVSQAMVPGSVTILRDEDGYFVCGRVKKGAEASVKQ